MGPKREGRVRLAMASQVVETFGDGRSGKDEPDGTEQNKIRLSQTLRMGLGAVSIVYY